MLDKFVSTISIILAGLAIVAVACIAILIGGFITWLLWPVVVPAIFPGLVASGAIAGKISIYTAMALYLLLGPTMTYSTKSNKE